MTFSRLALAILALLAVTGCGGESNSGQPAGTPNAGATPSAEPASDADTLVALGDSIAISGPQCDGCTSFVDLAARRLGMEPDNRAIPDTGVDDLVKQVKTDADTRDALKTADTVVVQIGFNDTPWNREDDPCGAAPQYPRIRWSRITPRCSARVARDYERSLDDTLAEVERLSDGELLVTTVYNSVIGDHVDPTWDSPAAVRPSIAANRAFARIQCRLAQRHGGACVAVGRAFNGAAGSRPAGRLLASDYTHPNRAGHAAIARLLAARSRRSP